LFLARGTPYLPRGTLREVLAYPLKVTQFKAEAFEQALRRMKLRRLVPMLDEVHRWDRELGEYILDWDDIRAAADPHGYALEFARSAFRHACLVCGWDQALAASAEGTPPPVV